MPVQNTLSNEENQKNTKEGDMSVEDELENERQLVCFRIANEEYGIDIMRVQEIIRIDTITEVPGAPHFVEGIVNLRGDVLPVINLRKRFGLPSMEYSDQNRILVVEMEGKITGLIVDAVSEVLRISEAQVEPTPKILTQSERGRYLDGIGKLNDGKRLILLMDVDSILTHAENEELVEIQVDNQAR